MRSACALLRLAGRLIGARAEGSCWNRARAAGHNGRRAGGGLGGDLFDGRAKMSRDVQQRRGGASAREAAEAPVRVRTRSEESKISAAMWARVVVLSVVVLGFVGGIFYASSKMRFVEDILPKISGASARPVVPPRRAPARAPPARRAPPPRPLNDSSFPRPRRTDPP